MSGSKATFNEFVMRPIHLWGISIRFRMLSPAHGQVPHVLLTRSPLIICASTESSFDLHVLSTPPAFILSQDQTLRKKIQTQPTRRLEKIDRVAPSKNILANCLEYPHGGADLKTIHQ